MIPYDPGVDRCLIEPIGGAAQADRIEGLMDRQRTLAALFVVLALAGCASVAGGPGQAPNAPHQQSDPRDTSGMH